MSRGNEGKYIDRIHRQVKDTIYHQKMNMMMGSGSGTPDVYYEGRKGHLWVEYKVIDDWTKKRKFPNIDSLLSIHQRNWLVRAVNNHNPVALIIGDLEGKGVILRQDEIFISHGTIPNLKSPSEIADEIMKGLCYEFKGAT